MRIKWIVFALAVLISLYVTFFGTIFMGFCPGIQCLPHTFEWTLLTPLLLLAFWSLRATAIAAVLDLVAHVFTEVVIYNEGVTVDTLWGTDRGLDKCLWTVVALLLLATYLPEQVPKSEEIEHSTK